MFLSGDFYSLSRQARITHAFEQNASSSLDCANSFFQRRRGSHCISTVGVSLPRRPTRLHLVSAFQKVAVPLAWKAPDRVETAARDLDVDITPLRNTNILLLRGSTSAAALQDEKAWNCVKPSPEARWQKYSSPAA